MFINVMQSALYYCMLLSMRILSSTTSTSRSSVAIRVHYIIIDKFLAIPGTLERIKLGLKQLFFFTFTF